MADRKIVPRLFSRCDTDKTYTIAVARDEAFNFYYADLFSLIMAKGFTIEFFSPIHGVLPDADGYILGGGYPEYFGKSLSENAAMMEDFSRVCSEDIPILAECGGLMYLCREIRIINDFSGLLNGDFFSMAGVLPATCTIPKKRIVTYVKGVTNNNSPFPKSNALPVLGHAFHYSTVYPDPGVSYAYDLERGIGIDSRNDGIIKNNLIASYTHLHPVPSRNFLFSFLSSCSREESR